jgi:hypothetical protein
LSNTYYSQPYNGQRQNITDILGCVNKWATIQFTNGTSLQAYLTSVDFSYATGYLPRNAALSLVCNGVAITNQQQAQACLNQWTQLTLPNGSQVSFYLTSYDNQYIGGSFQTTQLIGLSSLVTSITC